MLERLRKEGYQVVVLNPIQTNAMRDMLMQKNKLDQVFPEFESQFSTIFGKTALAVLHQYSTPEKLSRTQTGKLTEILQAASKGRFGEWKATQLKELARDSFGIPDCEGVYSTLLLLYLG